MKNIVLIGMPGCGKSTVGVLLAKAMGFRFIDTDIVIQNSHIYGTAINGIRLSSYDECDAYIRILKEHIENYRPPGSVPRAIMD